MRLRDLLHDGDPFADLDLHGVEPDLTGWGSTHSVFEAVLTALRPSRVIEVGTWKGGSAIHMADVLKRLGVSEPEVVCVDTWLGAPIAWTTEPHLRASLRLRGGYPQLYYTFSRNVVDAGLTDVITPLPASSDGARTILAHHGVTADVIYVDADHDYEPCKRDLLGYLDLLTPEGVLIGDDFGCFPGVTQAAKEVAEERDLFAVKQREKIVLSRVELRERIGLVSDGHYEREAA